MNLWKEIPAGDKPPELLNMVIEVADGSRDKYQYNVKWEVFILDRIIPSSLVFPVEYGFVPQTWDEDGDPLDVMSLSYEPLMVGSIAKVRVIGALIMDDENGVDPKILSVIVNAARFDGIKDIDDVHQHQLTEIQEFFATYKRLEPCKWTQVKGWKNAQKAMAIVLKAMKSYQELPHKISKITASHKNIQKACEKGQGEAGGESK